MFGLDRLGTRVIQIGAVVVTLIFAGLTMAYCVERGNAHRAKSEASIAAATGKALDKVAAETSIIRQEQEDKQRAVDQIQGADTPLPAGFGSDLERIRVRDAGKHHDSR